jgi:hypothetical protein
MCFYSTLTDCSVPIDVEHSLVWTKLPLIHPDITDEKILPRIRQDGLAGFTGTNAPVPPREALALSLPALAHWGIITLGSVVRSPPPDRTEEAQLRQASAEIDAFVRARWPDDTWETAWFVNPLVRRPSISSSLSGVSRYRSSQITQSIPGLAHIHVFAKRRH